MSQPIRFVIWFQHRSGSSHLVSLLNSHPEIRCQGEIFGCFPIERIDARTQKTNPNDRRLGNQIYRRAINRFPGRIACPSDEQCLQELNDFLDAPDDRRMKCKLIRGFKFKFPSQASLFPEVVDQLVSRRESIRLIALNRKNFLRRALSVLNLPRLQAATGRANVTQSAPLEPIQFDVGEIVRLIRYYQSIELDFQNWAGQFHSRLQIEYQDLIQDPQSIGRCVQEFLGTHQILPLKSATRRIGSEQLEDLALNADAIRNTLAENNLDYE